MIFNKIKYYILGLLFVSFTLASCNDDDDLGNAPRIFRPIATATSYENNITVKWDLLTAAKSYELELSVDSFQTVLTNAETEEASYTFKNLAWDETYQVRIKALSSSATIGNSEYFDCDDAKITYPTKLQKVTDVIDVAARITWKEGTTYTALEIQKSIDGAYTPVDTIALKDKDLAKQEKVVYGLEPETSYRIVAYSGESESYKYEGRQGLKTEAAEDFGTNAIDLRNLSDEEALDTINTSFLQTLEEGATVVLQGGFEYNLSSTVEIDKSIKFITGLSLNGNAIFKTGGFLATGENINEITFNKIDFITSGNKGGSNFGGKYIFNQNRLTDINTLKFIDCSIRYMRGVVRLQSKASTIENVTIENCIIDSIGGYGVLNCDVSGSQIKNVSISNSTIAHAEKTLVNSKSQYGFGTINISDCTFSYCSKTSNKIFDFGVKTSICEGLQFTATNCLFGPSFTEEATNGVSCSGTDSKLTFTNCYKTFDLTWISNESGIANNPLPGTVETYPNTSIDLWANPSGSNFTIKDKGFAGATTTGDPRWR